MGNEVCNALYSTAIANRKHTDQAYIILWCLCAIGCFIVIAYYLWIRRRDADFETGHVDKANRAFLYIYKFLIYIYISIVGFQTFLMTLQVMLIEIGNISFSSFPLIVIQSIILTLPHLQMSLIAFLYTKNTLSSKGFTRALKISVPYTLLTFISCLLDEGNWLTSINGKNISTSAILRVCTDLIFEAACMFIVCRQCQYSWKRKNVILRYLVTVMIITGFDFIAQVFQAGKNDGNCITQIGFYAWYIVYPLIFFRTVKDDSDYHWNYASKPLIESTQQSIADLDLFSLPGYHGVHFESIEDKKFRFKKLKQMVSGYVPIIPFNKINFNVNDDNGLNKSNNSSIFGSFSSNSSHCKNDNKPLVSAKNININAQNTDTPTIYKLSTGSKSKSKKKRSRKHSYKNTTIGSGSTSKVYRGSYRSKPVAVKCLTRLDKKSDMSWTDLTLIFRESILSSSLSHPNIVKFLGASLTYNGFFLVYEYCIFGDLQQILVEKSHPNNVQLSSIQQRLYYLRDIAEGMKYLHKSGFVHRDLKTANVVVNFSKKYKRFVGKICDFGVSRKLPKEQYNQQYINKNAHNKFSQSYTNNSNANMLLSDDNMLNDDQSVTISTTAYTDISGIQQQPASYPASSTFDATNNEHWQKIASQFSTKEISRTIHVGTPAFLAPEILLKLVKSKGVDLDKEKRKQLKRIQKKQKMLKKKQKQKQKQLSLQKEQLNNISEEKDTSSVTSDDINNSTSTAGSSTHYARGIITEHKNIDPMIYCGFATDVYSFGMILWSIVTSKLPYKGYKPMDMILMIKNAQRLNINDSEWKIWENNNDIDVDVDQLKDLLEYCWAQFPYQRPTFIQICNILDKIITDSHNKSNKIIKKIVIDEESILTYTNTNK